METQRGAQSNKLRRVLVFVTSLVVSEAAFQTHAELGHFTDVIRQCGGSLVEDDL